MLNIFAVSSNLSISDFFVSNKKFNKYFKCNQNYLKYNELFKENRNWNIKIPLNRLSFIPQRQYVCRYYSTESSWICLHDLFDFLQLSNFLPGSTEIIGRQPFSDHTTAFQLDINLALTLSFQITLSFQEIIMYYFLAE